MACKLYMAATRAGQRLVIPYVGEGAAGGDPIDPFSGTRITGWLRVEKEWEVPLTSRR